MKELIMDFKIKQREHTHIYIDRTTVEKVENFKFLGVQITDDLKWSTHTDSGVKSAKQHLFNLRRLKKFGLAPKTLTHFYICRIESILSGCITAWHGNFTKSIKDINHPSHGLFTPLSFRWRGRYRCIKAGSERLKKRFYLKAIRLLNIHHQPSTTQLLNSAP